MNKKVLLLLLTLPLIAGCNGSETYVPNHKFPGVITGEDAADVGEPMTVFFYLDYSHCDEPIHKMEWNQLKPLGECPKEAVLTDKNAPDPRYPIFLGYSEYSSSIDEDHLWNFKEDYKQGKFLNLYGIWASKGED